MAIIPRTAEQFRQLQEGGYTFIPGQGFEWIPQYPPPAPSIPPASVPTVSGVAPEALAASLFDKDIPVVLAGLAVIGGRIIEGPIRGTVDGESTMSWIAGYAINMNYEAANLTVTELRFRGKRAWTLAGGASLPGLSVGVPTVGGVQTVRFSGLGTLTQSPDPWSVSRFGANRANAYRTMITATFENIKVAQFNNLLPFTSIVVSDDTYCTPGELLPYADALPLMARFSGRDENEFEAVGLTGGRQAYFFAKKQSLLEYINDHRKFKPYWNIRLKDKLYVVEKTVTGIDLTIDRSMVEKGGSTPIVFSQAAAVDQPRKKNLTFVNVERDYDLDTVSALLETAPIPATTAFEEESIEISDVTTPDEVTSEIHYALFDEDSAREKGELTGKRVLYGLEVGDQAVIETDFKTYIHRITEVVRNVGCSIEIKTEGMLSCGIASVTPPEDCPVPEGAVAYISFICPRYWVDGIDYEIDAVIGGVGTPEVDANGLLVDGINGSWPEAVGPLFNIWKGLADGAGFTVVIEFQPITDEFPPAVPCLVLLWGVAGVPSEDWLRIDYWHPPTDVVKVQCYAETTLETPIAYIPLAPNKVAVNFLNVGHLAIALNGGGQAIGLPEDCDLRPVANIYIGNGGEENPGGYIREIILYPLQDDADLLALSAMD
jgi:hypothetical protein